MISYVGLHLRRWFCGISLALPAAHRPSLPEYGPVPGGPPKSGSGALGTVLLGTDRPVTQEPERTLVTPDTCMDLILKSGRRERRSPAASAGSTTARLKASPPAGNWVPSLASGFTPGRWHSSVKIPWQIPKNKIFPGESLFPRLCRELALVMEAQPTLEGRAQAAGTSPLSRLRLDRCSEPLLQASWELLRSRGSLRMEQLSRSLHVSTRQLERLFQTHMGLSPKTFACLMRYQLLWCDALRPGFDIQDAVFRYGFTDQSHLLHDFKKFHTMTLPQAQTRPGRMSDFTRKKRG